MTARTGTYVRGVRIGERTPLATGDDIQAGSIKLVFRIVEGPMTETEVWSLGA